MYFNPFSLLIVTQPSAIYLVTPHVGLVILETFDIDLVQNICSAVERMRERQKRRDSVLFNSFTTPHRRLYVLFIC